MTGWRICPVCGFKYRPYTQPGVFLGCCDQHTFILLRMAERKRRRKA
jgi:hypothetical protein